MLPSGRPGCFAPFYLEKEPIIDRGRIASPPAYKRGPSSGTKGRDSDASFPVLFELARGELESLEEVGMILGLGGRSPSHRSELNQARRRFMSKTGFPFWRY